MFSIKHNECVGFESRWTVKKVYYEGSTQTPIYDSKEKSTEPVKCTEIETQTDTIKAKPLETNIAALSDFMTKIYPMVKRELDDNNSSKALKNYKKQDITNVSSKLIQSLELPDSKNFSKELLQSTQISALCWNCTGRTLAISCSFAHQSWCYDNGKVLLYTVNRDGKFSEDPKIIRCESCVTTLKFHISESSILVGATHSGTIYLWNIELNDNDALLTKITQLETVTCLQWITIDHVTLNIPFLITSSLDSTIGMFKFNDAYTSATLYKKYKIKPPLFTKLTKPQFGTKKTKSTTVSYGITCFDFSKHYSDMFIVGTEGGLIIECSSLEPEKFKGENDLDPLYDPVVRHYEGHEGHVISVKISPNKSDMFMSFGSDYQTRIYILGQEEPARVIFFKNYTNPLYWVPREQNLMFGYGRNGKIEVYDVKTTKLIKDETKSSQNEQNISAYLDINPMKNNIIAVGINKGTLELWNSPWNDYGNMAVIS